ncbi:MAG: hypothetical protein SFU91_07490 [Chloroherpetonaceae bacterium]|nr:hypothetical protein [Chloroherpetonaceae bacterium]
MRQKTDAELAQRTKVLLGRLAKEPKAPAIIGIAEVLFLQGKFKEVITRLRAVADVYEDHSYRYHMILGKTYAATGDLIRARRHFEHALSIAPQSEVAPSELIKVETSRSSENLGLKEESSDLFIDEKPILPSEPAIHPEPQLFEKSIDFGYDLQSKQKPQPPMGQENSGVSINTTKVSEALSNLTGRIQSTGSPKSTASAQPISPFLQKELPKSIPPSSALNSSVANTTPVEIPQHLREALIGFSDDEIREFLKMDPSMAEMASSQPAARPAPIEEDKAFDVVSLPKGKILDLQKVALALPNISKSWKKTYVGLPKSSHFNEVKSSVLETTAKKPLVDEKSLKTQMPLYSSPSDKQEIKTPEELQAEAMKLLEAELGIVLDPMAGFEKNPTETNIPSESTSNPVSSNTFQDPMNLSSLELIEKELGASLDPLADFEKPVYAQDIPLPTSPIGEFDTSKLMEALKNLTPPPIQAPEVKKDDLNFFDQEKFNQSLLNIPLPNIPVPAIPEVPNSNSDISATGNLADSPKNDSQPNFSGINFEDLSKSLSNISLPPISPSVYSPELDLDKLAKTLSSIKLPPVYETGNPTPIEEQRKPFDDDDEIKTPTRSLAEIFTEQGALAKAVKVYEALQVLEPEKRGEYGIMITGLKAQMMMKKNGGLG